MANTYAYILSTKSIYSFPSLSQTFDILPFSSISGFSKAVNVFITGLRKFISIFYNFTEMSYVFH